MENNLIKIKIDGVEIEVNPGTNILAAAKMLNIHIPTLCFLEKLNLVAACKICLVEIKGFPMPMLACAYKVSKPIEVITNSEKIFLARKVNLELILADHNKKCLSCNRNLNCDLQRIASELGCSDLIYDNDKKNTEIDDSSACIVKDNSKCILCNRCVSVCTKMQNVSALVKHNFGPNAYIGCKDNVPIAKSSCVGCGMCVINCPTAALSEKNDLQKVINALNDPTITTVAAPAPSARVALGEEFGAPIGTNVEGKLTTSLRRCGFKHVFDIDFGADLTIVEESNELIKRLKDKNSKLPMFTSCCPGWVEYVTAFYPEFIVNLSTTKSPQTIFAAAVKTYWAQKNNLDPKKIFVTTIMPCTAKKVEIIKTKPAIEGIQDIDAVLTVREFAQLIRKQGIDFMNLPNSIFDNPLGESTGAGVIFGATGGVTEAVLRTMLDKLDNKSLSHVDYQAVRGIQGVKEATIKTNDREINVCVINGLGNVKSVLEEIKQGNKKYDFIEVMACPGGCVGGGGMPLHDPNIINSLECAIKRAKGLYKDDSEKKIRKSYENPTILKMYQEYFQKPGSDKAGAYLHNSFKKREFV